MEISKAPLMDSAGGVNRQITRRPFPIKINWGM